MDSHITQICIDAVPYNLPSPEATSSPSKYLDNIRSQLTLDDYRSIFFLMMDFIGPRNYLYFVRKDQNYLKDLFLRKFYEFNCKEAILVEIFGVMQRYDLLKIIGTCQHVYEKDKDTMNQISQFWKCLYKMCDQLADSDVCHLFPGLSTSVTCAEELFCKAFVENIFNENDLKTLKDIFRENHPKCSTIISSYISSSKLSYYPIRRPTRNSPCGKAVILNHENFWQECGNSLYLQQRTGSQKDADALKSMWAKFGFDATIHSDLTDEEVKNLFHKMSSEIDHSSFEAFVVCYLSHGDEGIVYASNSKPIKIMDLMDIMANKCPTLINKPKLFFIQACSGRQVQQGVGIEPCTLPPVPGVESLSSKFSINTPLYCDILMVCSSFPGFVSYRNSDGHSWFIGDLVETMLKFGEELTIMNIVTKVTNKVAKKSGSVSKTEYAHCKQIPTCCNTLKYELKLKKLVEHTSLQA